MIPKDPQLLAGLAQSLAAVLAVLFGWGLSVLTERRSWRRRKVEQIRDRQLTIVGETAANLRAGLAMVDDIERILTQLDGLGSSGLDEKSRLVLVADILRELRGTGDHLAGLIGTLETLEMNLGLLGVASGRISDVTAPISSLTSMRNGIRRCEEDSIDTTILRISDEVRRYRALVSSFVSGGIRGISG